MDDLSKEMERGERFFVSGDEASWCIEYERSQLPACIVFPDEGQIWEATHDCDVFVRTVFAAPASGGEHGNLKQGEQVRIMDISSPQPIIVQFLPVRYDALHHLLVSRATRRKPRYTSYYLSMKTIYFNEHFSLIEPVA